jgi:hypothetical protein
MLRPRPDLEESPFLLKMELLLAPHLAKNQHDNGLLGLVKKKRIFLLHCGKLAKTLRKLPVEYRVRTRIRFDITTIVLSKG